MVTRILTYCNPLKRKKGDTSKNNAPAKKARVVMMKQLAKEYNKVKIKKMTLLIILIVSLKKNLFILC